MKQMRGEYKVKNAGLKPLFLQACTLIRSIGGDVSFEHVRREFNKDADRLSNLGMDEAEAAAEVELARATVLQPTGPMRIRLALAAVALLTLQACAELDQLGALVQPPRFEQVPDQPAEIRLPGMNGAGVRLWTRVTNPNPFGFTLGTLKGTLFLDGLARGGRRLSARAAARRRRRLGDPDRHLDQLRDLPGLGDVARRVLARQPVAYRLDGTIGVDAGRLGQPVFGPMTLLRGETPSVADSLGLRRRESRRACGRRRRESARYECSRAWWVFVHSPDVKIASRIADPRRCS